METCANPGCSEPGTNKCAGCKTTPYCGPICQTAHWPTHKESCDGRLRKMGMDHLNKAKGFGRENNWPQLLRYSDLALTKLKQLKDRPLEDISDALSCKCTALSFLGQFREQLECAKEWYCLWNTKPTDAGAIRAAFALISSCLNNQKWADAHLYASTLYEIINHKHDNKIPDNLRQRYMAHGAYYLATAKLGLAHNGDVPPEEKQKAGQEAVALARKALDIHTNMYGTEHEKVANDRCVLAEALDYFNDSSDDEALRLFEQTKEIHTRVYGSSSLGMAIVENKLGKAYFERATKALAANDVNRYVAMLELALPLLLDAARIFRAFGRVANADHAAQNATNIEESLQQIAVTRAAIAAAAAAAATRG